MNECFNSLNLSIGGGGGGDAQEFDQITEMQRMLEASNAVSSSKP
jgi:hypothetical protein